MICMVCVNRYVQMQNAMQLRLAEITEMIHAASLFHDDVIDEADTRRGVPSVNKVFGNKLAILAGKQGEGGGRELVVIDYSDTWSRVARGEIRWLSIPDGPPSGAENIDKKIELLSYAKVASQRTRKQQLSQMGLHSNVRRLGPPIISIVLLYHLRRFYAVTHIRHQTLVHANSQSYIPPARHNCHDNAHSVLD